MPTSYSHLSRYSNTLSNEIVLASVLGRRPNDVYISGILNSNSTSSDFVTVLTVLFQTELLKHMFLLPISTSKLTTHPPGYPTIH